MKKRKINKVITLFVLSVLLCLTGVINKRSQALTRADEKRIIKASSATATYEVIKEGWHYEWVDGPLYGGAELVFGLFWYDETGLCCVYNKSEIAACYPDDLSKFCPPIMDEY